MLSAAPHIDLVGDCVFWDLETTGRDPKTACIVSITASYRGDIFSSLVNPGMRIPKETTKVHGLSDASVREALPWEFVGPRFLHWLASKAGKSPVLCAYNGERYDLPVLLRENQRLASQRGLPHFDSVVHMDPYLAAQKVVPAGPTGTYKQSNVFQHFYGAQPEGQHTSDGDVAALISIATHPAMAQAVLATARRVISLTEYGKRGRHRLAVA